MSSYNVRKKYNKFVSAFDSGIRYLDERQFPGVPTKAFIFQAGVINSIWQSWNSFWRTYWLAEVLGGYDLHNNVIVPYAPGISEEEAVSFLLTGVRGGRIKHSEEKSWGDISRLTSIAKTMYKIDGKVIPTIPISVKAQNVSSAMSLLGNSLLHLQLVRNCSIHLDEFNAKRIATILTYYSLPTYRYPTDLVFAPTISDGKRAIVSWQDELTTLLTFIY
jgi:hypothetical protein